MLKYDFWPLLEKNENEGPPWEVCAQFLALTAVHGSGFPSQPRALWGEMVSFSQGVCGWNKVRQVPSSAQGQVPGGQFVNTDCTVTFSRQGLC